MFYSVTAQDRSNLFRIECSPDGQNFRVDAYESYIQDESGELHVVNGQSPMSILSNLLSSTVAARVETDFGTDKNMKKLQKTFEYLQNVKNERIVQNIIFSGIIKTCYCKRMYTCLLCCNEEK